MWCSCNLILMFSLFRRSCGSLSFSRGRGMTISRYKFHLSVLAKQMCVEVACWVKCSWEALVSRAQLTFNCNIFFLSRIQKENNGSISIFRNIRGHSYRLPSCLLAFYSRDPTFTAVPTNGLQSNTMETEVNMGSRPRMSISIEWKGADRHVKSNWSNCFFIRSVTVIGLPKTQR